MRACAPDDGSLSTQRGAPRRRTAGSVREVRSGAARRGRGFGARQVKWNGAARAPAWTTSNSARTLRSNPVQGRPKKALRLAEATTSENRTRCGRSMPLQWLGGCFSDTDESRTADHRSKPWPAGGGVESGGGGGWGTASGARREGRGVRSQKKRVEATARRRVRRGGAGRTGSTLPPSTTRCQDFSTAAASVWLGPVASPAGADASRFDSTARALRE